MIPVRAWNLLVSRAVCGGRVAVKGSKPCMVWPVTV